MNMLFLKGQYAKMCYPIRTFLFDDSLKIVYDFTLCNWTIFSSLSPSLAEGKPLKGTVSQDEYFIYLNLFIFFFEISF